VFRDDGRLGLPIEDSRCDCDACLETTDEDKLDDEIFSSDEEYVDPSDWSSSEDEESESDGEEDGSENESEIGVKEESDGGSEDSTGKVQGEVNVYAIADAIRQLRQALC
jgi:hypothetical protein